MASREFVQNFCKIVNGTSSRFNNSGQGIGPAGVEALSYYMGLDPEAKTSRADYTFSTYLCYGIAGLVLGGSISRNLIGYSDTPIIHYWEKDYAREERYKILRINAGLLGLRDVDELTRISRVLTQATGALAQRLTSGDRITVVTEPGLRRRLQPILMRAWSLTWPRPLVIPIIEEGQKLFIYPDI